MSESQKTVVEIEKDTAQVRRERLEVMKRKHSTIESRHEAEEEAKVLVDDCPMVTGADLERIAMDLLRDLPKHLHHLCPGPHEGAYQIDNVRHLYVEHLQRGPPVWFVEKYQNKFSKPLEPEHKPNLTQAEQEQMLKDGWTPIWLGR